MMDKPGIDRHQLYKPDGRGLGETDRSPPIERNIGLITRFMRRDPGQQKIAGIDCQHYAGRRFRPCMSVKGNSTETTSPTLNAVIHRVVRRVVLKELFDGQSLPVEFFRCAANQVRQVTIQPKLVSEGQRLNRFFNFLNGIHGMPRFVVSETQGL